jgi:hypothetical protein
MCVWGGGAGADTGIRIDKGREAPVSERGALDAGAHPCGALAHPNLISCIFQLFIGCLGI